MLRNSHFYVMVCADLFLFALALAFSYLIRFDFAPPPLFWAQMQTILPYALVIKSGLFLALGLYKGMWRYTDLRDLWRLAQACIVGEVLLIAVLAWLYRFQGFSRGVFCIDLTLSFVFAGGIRAAIRTYFLKKGKFEVRKLWSKGLGHKPRSAHRCLIVGAGSTGEKLLREIIENPDISYDIVGFMDDDPSKSGRSMHGVQILGNVDQLAKVVRKEHVDEVLIAMPSAGGAVMRRVVEQCEQSKVAFKTLPGMGEIIDGRVSLSMFREVNLQDLLGRQQVNLDHFAISSYLTDKVILITGAGGSIGSELVRQVVPFQPGLLVLVDHAESSLYSIEMELRYALDSDKQVAVLGRVQDKTLMDQIFARYRPHVVFHAAAYKHVPLLEDNPWEAVLNNVLGSKVIMEAAYTWKTQRFVLVSTDKAVRPANVMGASKRLTELLMQALPQDTTRYMAVRFANVLGSAGSVIPLFQRQIKCGGPVTVTHPDMTRYFMTITEACQLIIQSGGMGQGGEIFVLNIGQPIRIQDMARDLIRLSGRIPDKDICIVFTGVRPGEKLYEELIAEDEGIVKTRHKDILVLRPDQDPTFQTIGSKTKLLELVDDLIDSVSRLNKEEITSRLEVIIPEYHGSTGTTVLSPRQRSSVLGEKLTSNYLE
jgi:FlaA1/EpsC-like NDP-sugar epimerase